MGQGRDSAWSKTLLLQNVIRRWNDRVMIRAAAADAAPQFGAIPYTVVQDQPVFLIVTSRRTGRWIFPKGAPMEGKTPWEVAAHEALEEAGVEGEIETESIGKYRSIKTSGIRRSVIEVTMFPLRMTRQLDDWRERASRYRHWVTLQDARRLLSDAELANLAEKLARRIAPPAF
jgi:8-oxo-dGTP pyrophosphatase MutT (NUDIX family)